MIDNRPVISKTTKLSNIIYKEINIMIGRDLIKKDNRPENIKLVIQGNYFFLSEIDYLNNRDVIDLNDLIKNMNEEEIPIWVFKYLRIS